MLNNSEWLMSFKIDDVVVLGYDALWPRRYSEKHTFSIFRTEGSQNPKE
jgi:hypothetical protein